MTRPLLEVRNLRVAFPIYGGIVRRPVGSCAVDDVSFSIDAGETLGLVGESGCGKTTVAKAIVNILRAMTPDVRVEGHIVLQTDDGPVDLVRTGNRAMRPIRSQIQMIFQDPFASLNPRMTVGKIIDAPLRIHTNQTAREREERVHWLLDRVGLRAEHAANYPHEFSGGQRQRVGIARALAVRPQLIVADEAVSALDVSVQAQVINLMGELQEEFGLTYLFVAHDLSVVYHVSHRIAVMYLGNLVEIGSAEAVYRSPADSYSQMIAAVPQPDPHRDRSDRVRLVGEIPSPLAKPSGCGFRTRCAIARKECADSVPPLKRRGDDQSVACPYTATRTPGSDA